jgi:hypothetical protein
MYNSFVEIEYSIDADDIDPINKILALTMFLEGMLKLNACVCSMFKPV